MPNWALTGDFAGFFGEWRRIGGHTSGAKSPLIAGILRGPGYLRSNGNSNKGKGRILGFFASQWLGRDARPLFSEESILVGIEVVGSSHRYSEGSERVQDADG